MTPEEMIEKCPDIIKITHQSLIKAINKVGYTEFDFNKTWSQNGFDELDGVETIMELEKQLGIVISDDVAEEYIKGDKIPIIFTQYNRSKKIEQLGL